MRSEFRSFVQVSLFRFGIGKDAERIPNYANSIKADFSFFLAIFDSIFLTLVLSKISVILSLRGIL